MIVLAPLKKGMALGIIYRKNPSPPSGLLKDIAQIHGASRVFNTGMLKLISWMSEYHLAPEGLVLKQAFPREIFTKTKRRKSEDQISSEMLALIDLSKNDLSEVHAFIGHKCFRTSLVQTPSLIYEYSVAAAILRTYSNVLVIFPEISQAELFYHSIREEHGERVCMLHSDMAAGRRSESVDGIIAGKYDLIIGTRAALFAPLKTLSLIMVISEHSSSYKLEEGIRLNVRNTAVMRGFLEKVPVMLISSAPSIDTWFNAQTHKYNLIKLKNSTQLPVIRIADLRFGKKRNSYLSTAVIDKARRALQRNSRILFIINRRGHATFLLCSDCGNTVSCNLCNIPLVHHKDRNLLECHYCAKTFMVPDVCTKCKSSNIDQLGAGTQRIEEDLRALFDREPLRFDSDSAGKKTDIRELMKSIAADEAQIIVGTKMLTKRLNPSGSFFLAALLNVDSSLNIPDFRAREKTYQDILSVRDLVAAKGELIVQTRFPQDSLFRHLRDGSFESFAAEELAMRAALNFPPYAKQLKIIAYGNIELAEKIVKIIQEAAESVEILGPTEKKTKKGTEYSFLLKHTKRRILHAVANTVITCFKNAKNIEIRIDADPY